MKRKNKIKGLQSKVDAIKESEDEYEVSGMTSQFDESSEYAA